MKEKIHLVIFLIAAMAAGYLGGLMSQRNTQSEAADPVISKVIEAERFELVDSEGNKRGTFDMVRGDPVLALYDSSQDIRGMFYLDFKTSDPTLCLYNSNADSRAIFCTINGEPSLEFYDLNNKKRGLFFMTKGNPHIVINNPSGKTVWRAP